MAYLGTLYLLTSPSGKQYVGITSRNVMIRFRNHVEAAWAGAKWAVSGAIRKYGKDSFKIETLIHAPMPMLKELEPITIKCFNTLAPGGYNLTTGGEFFERSEESQKMIRDRWIRSIMKAFWTEAGHHLKKRNDARLRKLYPHTEAPFQYLRKVRGS